MTENELRSKFVKQAIAWLGYKESNGTHKKIIDVYNAHSPLPVGYIVKYTDAWCATYVSAVAITTGLTTIVPCECSCPRQIELFKKLGRWQELDSYIPKIGDIIYYDWDDNGVGDNTGSSDHVGIVVSIKTDGKTITIIEGNKSNAVGYRTMSANGKYIRGYGIPDYASLADDYTAVTDALKTLESKGIINSPDYWLDIIKNNDDILYLDTLIINASKVLKSSGVSSNTVELGIASLVSKGIIGTPTYWLTNYTKVKYLSDLIKALGGAN